MAKAWDKFDDPVDDVILADYRAVGMTIVVSGDGLVMAIGSPPPIGKLAKLGGSVGTYLLVNGVWELDRVLEDNKPRKSDRFGIAIAINYDASRLVIGAPGAKVNGEKSQGRVVLYNYRVKKGKGKWKELAIFEPPVINNTPQGFGTSVGMTTDTGVVVVGSPLTPAPDGVSTGSVQVFSADPTGAWVPAIIYPPVNSGATDFGSTVTITPDTGVVGVVSTVVDPNDPNAVVTVAVDYSGTPGVWDVAAPVIPVVPIFKIEPKTPFVTETTVSADGLSLVVNTNTYTDMYPARGKELYFSNINGTWVEDD